MVWLGSLSWTDRNPSKITFYMLCSKGRGGRVRIFFGGLDNAPHHFPPMILIDFWLSSDGKCFWNIRESTESKCPKDFEPPHKKRLPTIPPPNKYALRGERNIWKVREPGAQKRFWMFLQGYRGTLFWGCHKTFLWKVFCLLCMSWFFVSDNHWGYWRERKDTFMKKLFFEDQFGWKRSVRKLHEGYF